MWQDFLLSIVGIGFTITLIPQLNDSLNGKAYTNKITSGITTIGCILISWVDITLNLYGASFISFLTGIIWLLLFLSSIRTDMNISKNV